MLRKRIYTWIIIVFVALSAMLFWWSYSNTYFAGDEILFCYRIDQGRNGLFLGDDFSINTIDRVESLGDAIRSQASHWRYGHGRNIITGVEQVFSGAWPTWLFYIVNTLVWVYSIWLTIWIGVKGRLRRGVWIWLLTVVCYFFLFPGEADLFTSINFSTNYLWPIAMTLTAFAIWNYYREVNAKGQRLKALALGIAALILAWSHEAWCLPMSGTLVVWYLWMAPAERKSLGYRVAWGYWIGSLILLSSPGNFNRTYNEVIGPMSETRWAKVAEMFYSIIYSNIFWILVAALIIWGFRKPRKIWDFIVANRFWWVLGVFSAAFVMAFHTTERSFTGVDMVSLVLLLRLVQFNVEGSRQSYRVVTGPMNNGGNQRLAPLAVVLMALSVGLMWYVAQLQRKVTAAEKAAVQSYIESPQGLAVVDYPEIPDWASQWVRCKLPTWFTRLSISWEQNNQEKIMYVLSTEEIHLLRDNPDSLFIPENRIGTSPFYTVDGALSAWTTDSTTKFQFWKWQLAPASIYDPVNPLRKLGRMFLSPLYMSKSNGQFVEKVAINDTVFYRIDKFPGRRLVGAEHWR